MLSNAEQALLSLLRANARASTAELARRLGVSRTTVQSRILGAAAPQHFNKPIAEAANKNIQAVGLPKWTADEQTFRLTSCLLPCMRAAFGGPARLLRLTTYRHATTAMP